MPRGRKHRIDSLKPSGSAVKRARKLSPDVDRNIILVDDSEDNELDAILAQIKEQEESEQLAKRLQNEWNHSSGSGDVVSSDASDEALARRLAQEWAEQVDDDDEPVRGASRPMEGGRGSNDVVEIYESYDAQPTDSESHSSDPTGPSHQSSSRYSTLIGGGTPDTTLLEFQDFFTANKECTKCGKAVKSPRGHVRWSLHLFF